MRNLIRNPGIFFAILYLLVFLLKFIHFRYVYSSTIALTGWNADAFLWSFVGKFLAENGFDWEKLSSLFEGYFSPTLSQAPFQGLFAPLYTLIVFLVFKMGGNLAIIRFFSIVAYAFAFPLMDSILRRLNFRLFTRWMVLLAVFFNIYTLSLSFKVRPDNFAFVLALLSLYLALKGREISSAILFAASVLGFKVQMALWGYFIAYFILVFHGWKKLVRFLLILGIVIALYFPYYSWISDKLPRLAEHLSRYNLVPMGKAFETIPAWSLIHFVGLFGLGILAIFYIGGWLPVSRFVLHLRNKMIPLPFPARSHLPNFILDMGYGYFWEVAYRMRYLPAKILMFVALLGVLWMHVSYGIKFFKADWQDTKTEDIFLREIKELSRRGKVCSIRSSRVSFYIPVPYVALFHRSPLLDENPLWEPEKDLIAERGCRYIAFIYYGAKPVQVLGNEINHRELVIMDADGKILYRDKWSGSYPRSGYKFGDVIFLAGGLVLAMVLSWEVMGTMLPLVLRK